MDSQPQVVHGQGAETYWLSSALFEGFLMTARFNHTHPTTHECVDSQPQAVSGQGGNNSGAVFLFVRPICGNGGNTLGHCPPYNANRKLICVVCSR